MQQIEQIFTYLEDIKAGVETVNHKVDLVEERLNAKIDSVEERLNAKIDSVKEELDAKIDSVEERLNAKIDSVKEELDAKIDSVKEELDAKINLVEEAMDTEINKVYQISMANKENIELFLIPFNDRNRHINEELDKMRGMEERLEEIEAVVGEHSEAIRKLQTA